MTHEYYPWRHRLSDVNMEKRTAVCTMCGPTTVKKNGTGKNMRCSGSRGRKEIYRLDKGMKCEGCGFESEHRCQLDVHHKDGDHSNDDPSNLETLCANCHRLHHYMKKLQGTILTSDSSQTLNM